MFNLLQDTLWLVKMHYRKAKDWLLDHKVIR